MEINERIKYLRKDVLKKTQQTFADAIKISRSNLGNIETGGVAVTERVLFSICEKFGINIDWLRTGEGEMKAPVNPDDRFAVNIAKLQRTDDETIINWVNMIAETSPEELRIIEAVFKKLIEKQ